MNLERSLVLNRYFHSLIGAERFDDLRRVLKEKEEGPGPDGHSHFFRHMLDGRSGFKLEPLMMAHYDLRIMEYEAHLAKRRRLEPFKAFKYFQYLALLYTEVYLDRLTENSTAFLQALETFRKSKADFADIPGFSPDDLRRLAFFMATGSGKTLLLHVNIWQVLHYLKAGKHPESLVWRSNGRAEFDNILLITPGEGLSAQHLMEFEDSGLEAGRFERGNHQTGLFGPRVQVIEIHKLVEEPSGEGVSVPIAELDARNLIIVDEGHKGTGSEARTWKNRQEALGREGFILEYSATFAQAIGAASRKLQEELLSTYGKSILFDYSYRYFYGDGYGKTFRVLNLKKASAAKAHEIMLGGLLIFYQQVMLHGSHEEGARTYNIEKPLWVLLGTSVSRKRPDEKDTTKTAEEERTDVGEVVAFLRRFLEEQDWAQERITKTVAGDSGFSEVDSGNDLGDVADFRKYLQEKLKIEVKQDVINDSLFERISRADSPINLLIGAKKFIEGWSSWRVSSMGLMRIGKGEGSQVIQLFGRGVRLKGKDKSLRRSHALEGTPNWLESLETLYITGWNADYLQTFRQMLDREDLAKELPPLRVVQMKLPLWTYVPQTPKGFDCSAETWALSDDGPRVKLDLLPQVVSLGPGGSGATGQAVRAGKEKRFPSQEPLYSGLLDIDRLHADLVDYKVAKGYANVFIQRATVKNVLDLRCELLMLEEEASDPEKVYRAASRALKTYLDKFVRLRERQAESAHAKPGQLVKERQVTYEYRITVHAEEEGERLYKEIKTLIEIFVKQEKELLTDAEEPLPRLHLNWHLFNPLLLEGGKDWQDHVSINPPPLVKSEQKLVEDLRAFWAANCKSPEYQEEEKERP